MVGDFAYGMEKLEELEDIIFELCKRKNSYANLENSAHGGCDTTSFTILCG